MRKHYIFIPSGLREYALQAGAPDSDWAKSLFDDITENGKKLTIVPLASTERGERLGLCGDKFFCHAGLEWNRKDCLFIFRVETANQNLRTIPVGFSGEYRPLPANKMEIPVLDPVAELFGKNEKQSPPPKPVPIQSSLSTLAVEILGRAPESLRALWRPGRQLLEYEATDEFLAHIRKPWIQFRLDQYVHASLRQDGLLKGLMRPQILSESDRDGLLQLFSLEVVNSFARSNPSNDAAFLSLIEELAKLHVPTLVQVSVWTAMLASLDSAIIRRELHAVADGFGSVYQEDKFDSEWDIPSLKAIRACADRNNDESLIELVDRAESERRALIIVASWARRLQFQEATPETKTDDQDSPEILDTIIAFKEPPTIPPDNSLDVKASPDRTAGLPSETVLDRWVLRMGIPDSGRLQDLVIEMENSFFELAVLSSESRSVKGMTSLLTQLSSMQAKLVSWLNELPNADQLKRDHAAAEAVYESARVMLPETIERLLEEVRITPSDLEQILSLLQRKELLQALPLWIWETEQEDAENKSTVLGDTDKWTVPLLNPLVRRRITVILDVFEQFGSGDIARLGMLPPISADSDIDKLTEHARDVFQGIAELVAKLSPESSALWRSVALNNPSDFYALQRFLDLSKYLTEHTAPDTSRQIIERLSGLTEQRRDLEGTIYSDAVEFFEKQFGTALEVSFPLYQAWVSKRAMELNEESGPEFRGSELSIEHNLTDLSGRRAPLTFSAYANPDRPYGFVSVPIVIETKHARNYGLTLEIALKTDQRKGWSTLWDDPHPSELTVAAFNWRKHPDKNTYIHTFKLTIPIRIPTGDPKGSERLEVAIRCLDMETGNPLSPVKNLKWDSIQGPTPYLSIDWPEGIEPNHVISHPIGPQQELEKIKSRVAAGGSFAVIAPRRFGKTTLVEYLRHLEDELELVIPTPIVCTDRDYFDGSVVDYNTIWDRISANLQTVLGSSITRTWQRDGLPDAGAFDHVRRSAKAHGKKGILILFDEAQLLFPKRGGHVLGDQLKDRLERSWARGDNPDLSRVLIGLIGLPSLMERSGANLMGLLRSVEKNQIDEEHLNSLILSVTRTNLSTTREARFYLAKAAGNLFILRTLLENLVGRLNQDKRAWANYDDAVAVHSMLKTSLREGQERNVYTYIRDALNDGETINEWKPGPSFPVAIALAVARSRSPGWRPVELLNSVAQILDEWCSQGSEADSTARPVYERHRIEEHLATLRERHVLSDLEFHSELLEAWLVGLARTGIPRDAEFQQALFQGAVVRIRIPDPLEPVGEGSQAEVFRYIEKNVTYAVRKAKLRGEEDRLKFLETNRALDVLKTRLHLREIGSEYIFNLQRVGIAENDEDCAIQIYHWINGVDLGKKLAQLPSHFTADIGVKLASALRLLHKNTILHRDIRPQNIILTEEDFKPVMVDFGFARMMDSQMLSNIANKYSAPEVRENTPAWSKAADIYSLAATLADILDPNDKHADKLRSVLATCNGSAENRPNAEELFEKLSAVHQELNVSHKRDDAWKFVIDLTAQDQSLSWFMRVLTKFRPYVEALALGVHHEQFDRCKEIANFLNQVLEAYPTGTGERLTLGKLKNDAEFGRDTSLRSGISFLHSLRTYNSHGDNKDKNRLLKGYSNPSTEDMKELTRAATDNIADTTRITSLRSLVETLLTGDLRSISTVETA